MRHIAVVVAAVGMAAAVACGNGGEVTPTPAPQTEAASDAPVTGSATDAAGAQAVSFEEAPVCGKVDEAAVSGILEGELRRQNLQPGDTATGHQGEYTSTAFECVFTGDGQSGEEFLYVTVMAMPKEAFDQLNTPSPTFPTCEEIPFDPLGQAHWARRCETEEGAPRGMVVVRIFADDVRFSCAVIKPLEQLPSDDVSAMTDFCRSTALAVAEA